MGASQYGNASTNTSAVSRVSPTVDSTVDQMTRPRVATLLGSTAAVLSLGACSSDPPRELALAADPAPVVVVADPSELINSAGLAGEVAWSGEAGDCVYAVGLPGSRPGGARSAHGVVWPAGTEWDNATSEIVLPDGERLGLGDEFLFGGGHHKADSSFLSADVIAEVRACGWEEFMFVQVTDVEPPRHWSVQAADPEPPRWLGQATDIEPRRRYR